MGWFKVEYIHTIQPAKWPEAEAEADPTRLSALWPWTQHESHMLNKDAGLHFQFD